MIFAIEGIDGAGKATATAAVKELLAQRGLSVACISFPQYGRTLASQMIGVLLNSDVSFSNPYVFSAIFALDRHEAMQAPPPADVLLCDRYVASNLAFQAARLADEDAWATLADWIEDFEFSRLALPRPAENFLLDIPLDFAERLIRQKAQRAYTSLEFDRFERDRAYQERVRRVYHWLAAEGRCGPWTRIDMVQAGRLRTPQEIGLDIASAIAAKLRDA